MESKINKKNATAREYYSLEMMLNDIYDSINEGTGDDLVDNKKKRESQHKLIVLQMLLLLANSFSKEQYADYEKLSNAIEVNVNGDELLSGYIFFVSQNSQFDYTWNYMRKRRNSYIEFLVEAVRFLNNVVSDISILASKPQVGSDIHVLFNDIFDVTLTQTEPYVKTAVFWENLYGIATVKESYSVSIKTYESVLLAVDRKDASDFKKLIDKAFELISRTKSDSK